jgi:hypothetical protein
MRTGSVPPPAADCWLHPDVEVRHSPIEGYGDYATSTADPAFTMHCDCRASLCRGTVTGGDWQRPDLRARYGRHWVPALLALIIRRTHSGSARCYGR